MLLVPEDGRAANNQIWIVSDNAYSRSFARWNCDSSGSISGDHPSMPPSKSFDERLTHTSQPYDKKYTDKCRPPPQNCRLKDLLPSEGFFAQHLILQIRTYVD
jgi:hypothetical protein